MKHMRPDAWFYDDDPIPTLPNGSAGYVSSEKSYDRPPLQFPGIVPTQRKSVAYAGKAH